MDLFKCIVLAFILTGCFKTIEAMGVCAFATKYPCEEKEGLKCYKNPGFEGRNSTKKIQAVTQSTTRKTQSSRNYSTTGHDTTRWDTSLLCPPNMVFANCTTCQSTCRDPKTCITSKCSQPETCVCPDGFLLKGSDCVPKEECECFVEGNGVIPNGETYFNANCSERCNCTNDQLNCYSGYECHPNAECQEKGDVRQCYCNEGYIGDGETCDILCKDCDDVYLAGHTEDGVYTILPRGWPGSPFKVFCDMTNDGRGWTVIQRRIDGNTDFYRNWTSYKHGFGSLNLDFWLGNEKMFYLLNQATYKLRIDIVNSQGVSLYDEYALFRLGSEDTKYQILDQGAQSGNAGDGMRYTWGLKFSTFDQDNDLCDEVNCAVKHKGAWWYHGENNCPKCYTMNICHYFMKGETGCETFCSQSNLNGDYHGGKGENIFWNFGNHCYLRSSEMKVLT